MRSHNALSRALRTATLTAFALLNANAAGAQTWTAPRTRPSIAELVAVDATGEAGWPFGYEDLADDGRAFAATEQAIDVRSAYAVTGEDRLWVRAYVASTSTADTSLRLYVFIDADRDASTGGPAIAPEIEPEFVSDPSSGGYEHVLGLSGTGSVLGFWTHRPAQGDFALGNPGMMRAHAEVGTDVDPLRLGEISRGFVGGSVELAEIPLATSCGDTALFFRAVSDTHDDLDVGPRAECVSPDDNDNRIPNVAEDVPACDADADCPASGRCIDGRCRFAPGCVDDAECDTGRTCQNDRCVVTGGETCTSNADCEGLLCDDGRCVPCDGSGLACGAGRACGPDGQCVAGTAGPAPDSAALVDPDERVQGGAFTCAVGRASGGASFVGLAFLIVLLRERRRNERAVKAP